MKRVEEYSQAELLTLGDDEVTVLAEIECMIDGVQMVPPPGPEPVFGQKLEKTAFFRIDGALLFPTAESAMQAASLAVRKQDYEGLDGTYSAKNETNSGISTQEYYLYEDLMKVKANKAEYETVKSAWNSRERAYNNYLNKKNKAETRVYDAIRKAQEELGAANDRVASFTKYVELADDPEIAEKFFREMLKKQDWSETEIEAEVARVRNAVV